VNPPLPETFTNAHRAYESARQRWNATSTPRERQDADPDLTVLKQTRAAAATALLADAASRHRIDELSVIWLRLNEHGWQIEDPIVDGPPLNGFPGGPFNEGCECDDQRECAAVRMAATLLPLPTMQELLVLLADACGYTLTRL